MTDPQKPTHRFVIERAVGLSESEGEARSLVLRRGCAVSRAKRGGGEVWVSLAINLLFSYFPLAFFVIYTLFY